MAVEMHEMNLFFGCHTTITVLFLVRTITTILTITLEKKTQISRFLFVRRFRDISVKKSRTQVKFFNHQFIASSN